MYYADNFKFEHRKQIKNKIEVLYLCKSFGNMRGLYVFLLAGMLFTLVIGCKSADIKDIYIEQPTQENTILPIQKKYGEILGIAPQNVKNIQLYSFIDNWENTPYRMGGETKRGIDCSFFTQFLYHDVYNSLIERTAEKQYMAPDTDKFIGQEFLKQGDLLFFNLTGSQYHKITHVGVYLGHDKFVHSTARKASNGNNVYK